MSKALIIENRDFQRNTIERELRKYLQHFSIFYTSSIELAFFEVICTDFDLIVVGTEILKYDPAQSDTHSQAVKNLIHLSPASMYVFITEVNNSFETRFFHGINFGGYTINIAETRNEPVSKEEQKAIIDLLWMIESIPREELFLKYQIIAQEEDVSWEAVRDEFDRVHGELMKKRALFVN